MKKRFILFLIPALFLGLVLFILGSCAGAPSTAGYTSKSESTAGGDSFESGSADGSLPDYGAGEAAAPESAPVPESAERRDKAGDSPSGSTRAGIADDEGVINEMDFMEEPSEESSGMDSTTARRGGSSSGTPGVSGLKAGFADDNKQYGYFINFLKEYESTPHIPLPVDERIILTVTDSEGKPIPNAEITVEAGGNIEKGLTTADGIFQFFPSLYRDNIREFPVTIEAMGMTQTLTLPRESARKQSVSFETRRTIPERIPLDILFIFDTTGSMGEEIDRLRTTIELIHMNLANLSVQPEVRFGMVLYKDIGDEYRTRTVPLTGSLEEFQAALDLVEASGGGDTPEDLQEALKEALTGVEWNSGGIRLAFIITDAPPHLDYGQQYDYVQASRDAKEKGIKIFSVGTGGLEITGEYVLRQISQFTSGKYIFLTYGEGGESSGGRPGSVSHHTGTNFTADKLEAIIIRFAKEELSYLTDKPIEEDDDYFVASKMDYEAREETLNTLFEMALVQLLDFSTIKVEDGTPSAVLPLLAQDEKYGSDAEYFTDRLLQQAIVNSRFRIVERQDLQSVMNELKLQLSGLTDDSNAAEVGKLLNADLLINGTLYRRRDNFELFLKMLRVESGEILSVTKAKLDPELGLTAE